MSRHVARRLIYCTRFTAPWCNSAHRWKTLPTRSIFRPYWSIEQRSALNMGRSPSAVESIWTRMQTMFCNRVFTKITSYFIHLFHFSPPLSGKVRSYITCYRGLSGITKSTISWKAKKYLIDGSMCQEIRNYETWNTEIKQWLRLLSRFHLCFFIRCVYLIRCNTESKINYLDRKI